MKNETQFLGGKAVNFTCFWGVSWEYKMNFETSSILPPIGMYLTVPKVNH